MQKFFNTIALTALLTAPQITLAEEIVPLDPRILRIIQNSGFSTEGVMMTQDQQDYFLGTLSAIYAPSRSTLRAYLDKIERERVQANSSGPSLRDLMSGDQRSEEQPPLTSQQEQTISNQLRQAGFDDIDPNSLTRNQQARFLSNYSHNPMSRWKVRAILNNP